MKNGYKLLWSVRTLSDLKNIVYYLLENWTEKELKNFARSLDKRLEIILFNPRIFPKTRKGREIIKSVLTKRTVIYYETSDKVITIVTLFDPRQNPNKLKL